MIWVTRGQVWELLNSHSFVVTYVTGYEAHTITEDGITRVYPVQAMQDELFFKKISDEFCSDWVEAFTQKRSKK